MDFCTYFDHRYLVRALALHDSMVRHLSEFRLFALCLDARAYDLLARLALPGVEPVRLCDLEAFDTEALATRGRRSLVEYYFTLTPSLPRFIFESYPQVESVTYLDSDLYFFSDIEPMVSALATKSVLIIPHRFSKIGRFRERYGIYNVGWVTWRNDAIGRACLDLYRDQCLEWCSDKADGARFADQKYLEEWPHRFPKVGIVTHKGCNLAPWNLENYQYEMRDNRFYIDDDPLIFYHFHAFRDWNALNAKDTSIESYVNGGINFDIELLFDRVYKPYVETLRRSEELLRSLGVDGQVSEIRHTNRPPDAAELPRWPNAYDCRPATVVSEDALPLEPVALGQHRAIAKRYWAEQSLLIEAPTTAREQIFSMAGALLDPRKSEIKILTLGGANHALRELKQLQTLHRTRLSIDIVDDSIWADHVAFSGMSARFIRSADIQGTRDLVVIYGDALDPRGWLGQIRTCANTSSDMLLLHGVRTFTTEGTLLVAERAAGRDDCVSAVIVNRLALGAALREFGFEVARELVWLDPTSVEGIAELADRRSLLLRKPGR